MKLTTALTGLRSKLNVSPIGGAFLFTGMMAVAGTGIYATSNGDDQHSSIKTNTTSQAASTTSASAPDQLPVNSDANEVSTGATLSTSVSSSVSGNGVSSTEVTVNGQPVEVPQNSTKTQTVTSPDGRSTMTTTIGRSSNSNNTSSSLNVTSSSSSSVQGSNSR